MKRCPECGREYDNTMMFCLDDGAELLYGPARSESGTVATGFLPNDESATAILHSTDPRAEAPTRAQTTTTNDTAILPSDSVQRPASSAEYLVSQVQQHKFGAALIVILTVVVIAGVGLGIYKFGGSKKTDISFESAKLARVTSTGRATHASISPDGKYIVHVVADAGKESLWVRQTATGSNVQIVAPAEVSYWGMTFSRDGDYVYYVSRDVGKGIGLLYRVPALGGTPDTLVKDVDSSITISPDGTQMAFERWNPFDRSGGLWIANSDGTSARNIAKRSEPESLTGSPAWSPDGRTVACPFGGIDAGTAYNGILSVRVSDGEQKLFTPNRWGTVGRINWVDNNGIILNASEQGPDKTMQLWYVSFADGQSKPLTHDLSSYGDISLSGDSNTLVTVQQGMQSNLFVTQTGDEEHPRQLTSGKGADGYHLGWTPDGKIVYDSSAGAGLAEISVIKPDGSEPKRLTSDQNFDESPVASSDGRYIIYASNRSGVRHIWRMGPDGRNPVQLTSGDSLDRSAALSPDGQWVFFSRGSTPGILKVSINGGETVQLGQDVDGLISAVAPDGQTIAYWDYEGDGQIVKIISAVDGSGFTSFSPPPTAAFLAAYLSYSADGRSINYLDTRDGISNIWSQPLDGGPPKPLTKFKAGNIFCFAYSPDGKQLAFTKGAVTNDVVLISGFRR